MVKIIQVKKKEPAPTVPVPKPVRKQGILSKMIEVIKEDLNKSTRNIRAEIVGEKKHTRFWCVCDQGKY
jgi:hypothetical protein